MPDNLSYRLVSVVISTYNGSRYLSAQLDSIFTQDYPNMEVIAVDDGSVDNTLEILQQYSNAHPGFKVFQNKINLGYIKNFEYGMSLASGSFIAVCDQDDIWESNKISLMVAAIENYPMLYCDSNLVDADLNSLKKKLSDLKNLSTYNNCLVFATDNCVAGHATLITKELYDKAIPFNPSIAHDWWLPFISTFHGGIKYLDKPLVQYRNHSHNIIGAVKTKQTPKATVSKHNKKIEERERIRARVLAFYEQCPSGFVEEKKVLGELLNVYSNLSFTYNMRRVFLYFKYRKYFLAIKKCSTPYKYFYCIKQFFKIR